MGKDKSTMSMTQKELQRKKEKEESMMMQEAALESGILIDRQFQLISADKEELHFRELGTGKSLDVSAFHGSWDQCELQLVGTVIGNQIEL